MSIFLIKYYIKIVEKNINEIKNKKNNKKKKGINNKL